MLSYPIEAEHSEGRKSLALSLNGRLLLQGGSKNPNECSDTAANRCLGDSLDVSAAAERAGDQTEGACGNIVAEDLCRLCRGSGENPAAMGARSNRSPPDLFSHLDRDTLTGLPNRAVFATLLAEAYSRRRSSAAEIVVLTVDIDNFKIVNDSLGIGVGDGLLYAVARRIQQCMPADTTIAMIGGDEFAILLDETSKKRGRLAAERLVSVLKIPFQVAGHTLHSAASIGVASDRNEDSSGDLLRDAEIAMSSAKVQARTRGRSSYTVFNGTMLRKAEDAMQMDAALRNTLRRGGDEFHLVYQPIYNIRTRQLYGMESLLRWQHPEIGAISPSVFIPLAEQIGLIHELTDWVLREAGHCHALLRRCLTQSLQAPFISVNFSAFVLQSEGMASHILNYLRAQRIETSCLAVEITESAMARQSPMVLQALDQLRASGVRVFMDDFGTGYSSLASLVDLPVDVLKIDRAFLKFLEEAPKTRAILQAIVNLGDALRMKVICEGIERTEQCNILEQMGDVYGQGYLFSHPMTIAQLESFLAMPQEKIAASQSL